MSNAIVRTVSLLKSAARAVGMYCHTCGRVTPHSFRPAGSWEEYQCTVCGNVQPFKVR